MSGATYFVASYLILSALLVGGLPVKQLYVSSSLTLRAKFVLRIVIMQTLKHTGLTVISISNDVKEVTSCSASPF